MKPPFRDYLRGVPADDGTPTGDVKPEVDSPNRAWLTRAEDIVLDFAGGDPGDPTDDDDPGSPWAMTVERFDQDRATSHEGEYDDLLAIAREAGVTEFYVFDATSGEFNQLPL